MWLNQSEIADFPKLINFFFLNDNIIPNINPNINIEMMFIFDFKGINIICSDDNIHEVIEPDVIEIIDINEITIKGEFVKWFSDIGFDLMFSLFDIIDIRIEYDAVIPIDIIIIVDKINSSLEDIIFSIIKSFEKNPDVNGNPIRAMLVVPKTVDVNVEFIIEFDPIIRLSWYDDSWIIIPAHKNIVDLKIAWIIKWEKAIIIELIEIANIIIAICLNVDKAMIFFISCSQFADILEYRVVALEIIISNNIILGWILFIIRININTPAVTKVDECTSAEIGVGAAIAIGNHAENGNWALLEHAAINRKINAIRENSSFNWNFQFIDIIINLIDIRIIISPTRLLNKVIDPEAAVIKFW